MSSGKSERPGPERDRDDRPGQRGGEFVERHRRRPGNRRPHLGDQRAVPATSRRAALVVNRRRRDAGFDQLDPPPVHDLVVRRRRHRDRPPEMVGNPHPHAAKYLSASVRRKAGARHALPGQRSASSRSSAPARRRRAPSSDTPIDPACSQGRASSGLAQHRPRSSARREVAIRNPVGAQDRRWSSLGASNNAATGSVSRRFRRTKPAAHSRDAGSGAGHLPPIPVKRRNCMSCREQLSVPSNSPYDQRRFLTRASGERPDKRFHSRAESVDIARDRRAGGRAHFGARRSRRAATSVSTSTSTRSTTPKRSTALSWFTAMRFG